MVAGAGLPHHCCWTKGLTLQTLRHTLAATVAGATALALSLATVSLEPTTTLPARPTAAVVTADVVAPEVVTALDAGPATVIVRVDTDTHAAALAAVTTVVHDLPLIDGFVAEITTADLGALLGLDGVRSIVLDSPIELADGGAPAGDAPDSSFVETIGADVLHAAGHDGSGVGIAIIDTGVTEVADLDGRVSGGLDLSGENDHVDKVGHGTFIAGVAAGDGTSSFGEHAGVAPGATIIPVKIAGRSGAADVSHVLAALQYVVSMKDVHGIDIVNLSLGTDSTQPNSLSPLNYAVEQAWDAGIVVVISSGNHGERGAGHIPKPADDPLVITVGATDSNGTVDRADDEVAPFSSRGPSIADGIVKPDIVAPGVSLVGLKAPGSVLDQAFPAAHLDGGYARASGTSFAAGVVSGAAALLLDAHPDWTPDQVKAALMDGAAPGPVGEATVDGAGAVDLVAAVAETPAAGWQSGIVRSTGLGSVAADRGSLRVMITPTSFTEALAAPWLEFTGERMANGLPFDPTAFTSGEWTSSSWYSSSWYSSSWYSSSWYSSSWYSSSWYSSSWYSSSWYSSSWYSSSWYSSSWYSSSWYSSSWYSSSWY